MSNRLVRVLLMVISVLSSTFAAQAAPSRATVRQWEDSIRARHTITTFDVAQNAAGRAEGVFFIAGTLRPQAAAFSSGTQSSPSATARQFLTEESEFFGLDDERDLTELETARDRHGNAHVTFIRKVAGLELDRMTVIVHVSDDGVIHAVNGYLVQVPSDLEALVTEKNAAAIAADRVDRIVRNDLRDSGTPVPTGDDVTITVRKFATVAEPYVVYDADAIVESAGERWRYRIDATTSAILEKKYAIETNRRTTTPGGEVREVPLDPPAPRQATTAAACRAAATLIAAGEVTDVSADGRQITFRPSRFLKGSTVASSISVAIPDIANAAPAEMQQFSSGRNFVLFLREPAPGSYELCGDASTNPSIGAGDRIESGEPLSSFQQTLPGAPRQDVPSHGTLDRSHPIQFAPNVPKLKPNTNVAPSSPVTVNGIQTIFSDGFEGAFPGSSWQVFDGDGTINGEVYWDDTAYRSYSGSWSAWCAGGGSYASTPGTTYRNGMNTWMIYGPFNLSDATAATFSLKYWLQSESGYDTLNWWASADGSYFGGYYSSGNSGGWQSAGIDLSNVPYVGNLLGDSSVWIALVFRSDSSYVYEGAYVDDVLVQKTTGSAELSLTSVDALASSVMQGGTLNIANTVSNIGSSTASSYRLSFYASANSSISTGDYLLGYVDRGSLAGGFSHSYTTAVTVPSGVPPGSYYIGAIVTYADANATNNTNYDPVPVTIGSSTQYDLSLTLLDGYDGPYQPNEPIVIGTTIANVGTATSPGFRITYYVSPDSNITPADVSLGYIDRTAISAGGNQSYGAVTVLPSLAAGYYYIGAILTIADTNSANNTRVDLTPIRVGSAGDGVRIGSGTGVLGNSVTHLDTFFDSVIGSKYFLEDVTRRSATNPHGHGGAMPATASIKTQEWGSLASWPSSDPDNVWTATAQRVAVDAHFGAGRFYDYLRGQLGLNGPNGNGMSLFSSVHAGGPSCPDNAYWNGARVNYCDGSSYLPLVGAFDVVGHEWAHAITELSPGARRTQLAYERESGALNEAFSDWFGTAVEHYYGESNWTLGEGIAVIRDMANPNAYGDPAYVNDPYWFPVAGCTPDCSPTGNDCCGVHTNSGVPNKMFYLLANGGTFRGVTVAGVGTQTAIDIALDANRYYWTTYEAFLGARNGMITVASSIYGSAAAASVRNAWAAVGVGDATQATCYALTRGHLGSGADPVATPANSSGCTAGQYIAGQSITLTAAPAAGWHVRRWTGTASDASTSTTNSLVMPASARTVTVEYTTGSNIIMSPTTGFTTTEAGGSSSFTLRLDSQPAANVTIQIYSTDTTEGIVTPSTVTFTSSNWSTPQTVRILGVDDAVVDGTVKYAFVTNPAVSADPAFNGADAPNASVWNYDNDVAGVIVAAIQPLRTTESGGAATFTVRLSSQPIANVTFGIQSNDLTEGTVAPSSVTFTSSDWNIARLITVTGVNDAIVDGNIAYTILLNPATSADPLYNTHNPPDVSAINADNDVRTVKGDFNGDGKSDIVFRNLATGVNQVWLMNGTARSSIASLTTLGTSMRIAGTADFDGDGKTDLLLRNASTGAIALFLLDGVSWRATVNLSPLATAWQFEGTGDFNADGRPDILARNYSTGQNMIWIMNGTSYAGSITLPSIGDLQTRMEGAGDFNGDGKPDILFRNYSTGANFVWAMNGTTVSQTLSLAPLPNTAYRIEGVADFDGNGKPDIVWRNNATGANMIWLMINTAYNSAVILPSLQDPSVEINGPR